MIYCDKDKISLLIIAEEFKKYPFNLLAFLIKMNEQKSLKRNTKLKSEEKRKNLIFNNTVIQNLTENEL